MLSSIEKVHSKLRQRTAAALRKNLWLAPAATIASLIALAATIVFRSHWLIVTAAAAGVVVTAFVWGYSTSASRMSSWPTLGRIRATYRGNYDRLAAIKAKYDPGNFFRVNQNIRPAA